MKLRQLFNEALNDNQKKYVDDLIKNMEYNPAQWDHIFGNESRIYLPMSGTADPSPEVVNTLALLGYKILDYIAGTAISSTPRQYTANVVFGRNPDIYQAWESDPHRTDPKALPNKSVMDALATMQYDVMDYAKGIFVKPPKPESIGKIFDAYKVDRSIANKFEVEHSEDFNTSNQVIVITRDKYEVAEVSTNKKWSSCLNLGGGWTGLDELGKAQGENAQPAVRDVAIGSIAAYLVKKDDMNLDDPVARVSMKPFISDTTHHIALGVHDKVYGRGAGVPAEFREKVKEWADAVNASQELDGLFRLHPHAYNYNEFSYQNTTQTHGNYETDKQTYSTYQNAVTKVPPELLTIGYLKMVLANDPTNYPTVVSRAQTAKAAMELTKTFIKNSVTGDISTFPPRFIDEAPKEFFELLTEIYQITPGVINFLPEGLYENYRTELLRFYQMIVDKYNDGLRHVIKGSTDIQELYDILKLKVGTSTLNIITRKLIRRADPRDELVDKDAFLTILSNPNCDADTMNRIFDYAQDEYQHGNSMDFYNNLDDKMRVVIKNLATDIKNASNSDELADVVNAVNRLNSMYTIDPKIYGLIANNEHINDQIVIKLMASADSDVIFNLIKNDIIPNSILSDIDSYTNLSDDKVWEAVHNLWVKRVKEDRIDTSEVAKFCKDLSVINWMVKSDKMKGSDAAGVIVNILKGEYADYGKSSEDECLYTILKHHKLSPKILFYIKSRLPENYYIEDSYKIDKLISNILTHICETGPESELRDLVYNYDSDDSNLTKKIIAAAIKHDSINVFHDLYVRLDDVSTLDKVFPTVMDNQTNARFSDLEYIYSKGSEEVKESIIKNSVIRVRDLLDTDGDDERIKEIKHKRLLNMAKHNKTPVIDTQLYNDMGILPPDVFVAYAKRINLADDMIGLTYRTTDNPELRKAIKKNFTSTELPSELPSDEPNSSTVTDVMKALLAKGKEQGTLTNEELDAALQKVAQIRGEEFDDEQREDIITMLNDMGIQVV
jgi:hypothetical protein